ncbi:MAG: NAD-dependent epimerase/dehydratase family protein [bacterium]|nr:NAD-dependent epimerase/dehydratase family protein [bacterium]
MAGPVVFMTGAGGFIGRNIVARYLARPGVELLLIEHPGFVDRLRQHVAEVLPKGEDASRVQVLEGDITKPGLGLSDEARDTVRASMTHALHLAAIYDLSVPAEVAHRVNVDGTRNVLDLLEGAPRLERFGHISTCAVSGSFEGTFTEDDFDVGQSFKNHYEETKYLSEKLVRERRDRIPTAIFRPGYVVGDSKTGEFDKIDGPYFALVAISRNLHLIMPEGGESKCNAPPVDYVTDACVCLLEDSESTGRVYHLTDPAPLTWNAFTDRACAALGKRTPLLRVPVGVLKAFFRLPFVGRLVGLPYDALVYTGLCVEYDTSHASEALARYGIQCPQLPEYVDTMVAHFKEHHGDAVIRRGPKHKEIA